MGEIEKQDMRFSRNEIEYAVGLIKPMKILKGKKGSIAAPGYKFVVSKFVVSAK